MKIVVLMSTYNGEKYLKEQIDSILNQSVKNIELIVRDDGSDDTTKEILNDYVKKNDNIKVIWGENIGVAKSYRELLKYDIDADLYAFCDQDDIWLENKVEKAIEQIKKFSNVPALYYSEVNAVNNEMETLLVSKYTGIDTLGSSFNTTPVIGCTVLFNNKLKEYIKKYGIAENIIMHDLYMYRLCLAVGGKIVHDKNSYILYRQHANNVVGITATSFKKLKVYDKFKKTRRIMAKDILNLYDGNITEHNKRILDKVARFNDKMNLFEKLEFIFDKEFKSKKIKSDLKFIYDVFNNKI